MHHSLRRGQNELDYLNRESLNGRLEWPEYQSRLLKAAELHYGHLHGHHRVEDIHHFPKMRQREPKLARGFDILDSDHHAVDTKLRLTAALLGALKAARDPVQETAEKLERSIRSGGELLYRHLADEEDLVIPILALQE